MTASPGASYLMPSIAVTEAKATATSVVGQDQGTRV